jgi:rod shape-determining protein MreC
LDFRNKRLIFIALLVSAVISPFIFFSSSLRSWQNPGPIVLALQEAIYPLEYAFHQTLGGVSNAWKSYVDLHGAAQENLSLRGSLQQLQTRIVDYEEQIQENERLRRLLGFAERAEKKLVAAEVIGANTRGTFQSLRITRGSDDGIKVGMPVATADGVVGRIIRVGKNFSDLQLLIDPDFHLDVLLQRTRVRGVVSGDDKNLCKLQLHKRVEIRIGDTLITSGIVGGFPKGLPVGRVMRITYESDNVAQSITIEPWVDHRRLEEVMVIFSEDPELSKILETAGSEWLEKTVGRAMGG